MKIIKKRGIMSYRLKSPIRANLEITESCNHTCVHCYNYWRYQETGILNSVDDMKLDIQHFLRIMDILIEQEIQSITLTGGEPFLRKDVLFPLVKKAKDAGLSVFINTNATLITVDDAKILKEMDLDGFLISLLSGNKDTHNKMTHSNTHQKAISNIKMLLEEGHYVSINMVVSRDNYKEVRMTAKEMKNIGVHAFSATPMTSCYLSDTHENIHLSPEQYKEVMYDLIWAMDNLNPMKIVVLDAIVHCMFDKEERRIFSPLLGDTYCCAGISDCAISPTGDLRPCIMATDIGGNILKDGWDSAWKGVSRWREPSMIPTKCLDCSVVDSCGGGCRAAAKATTGEYNGRDPYMLEPLEDRITIKEYKEVKGKIIGYQDNIRFVDSVKTRKEDFGGIFINDENYLFLEKDAFDFIKDILKYNGSFTILDLIGKYDIKKEEVHDFFQVLLDEGYIVLEEGEK